MTRTDDYTKRQLAYLIQRAAFTEDNRLADSNHFANRLMRLPKPLLQRAAFFASEYLQHNLDQQGEYDYRSMVGCLEGYWDSKDKKEYMFGLNVPSHFLSGHDQLPEYYHYPIPGGG